MPPSSLTSPQSTGLLYRHRDSVKVGEIYRYIITYTPNPAKITDVVSPDSYSLWLKVKNLESVALRAAYLAGPYILYVDVRPKDYDQNIKAYSSADQPSYEPQLKAGQSFHVQLFMNKVSSCHTWIVDVVSQIIFSPNTNVHFELVVGRTRESIHNLPTHTGGDLFHLNGRPVNDPEGTLQVRRLDTIDLWHQPTPRNDKPLHIVVLTHGLHSNTGADMLYVKEKIDEMAVKTGENVAVRGYFDNVCKTEKGIKYLGRRLGDYVVKTLVPSLSNLGVPMKISFIAHSLGGLVQTFALAHIQVNYPEFFDKIKPENFICLATPFLGLSNENPKYVKFVLDVGFAGKSGRDLGLTWKFDQLKKHKKPILQILPTGPAHKILVKFKHRTIYANSVNDGIVPLRTSAILYLDWRGISKASMAQKDNPQSPTSPDNTASSDKLLKDSLKEGTNNSDNSSSEDPIADAQRAFNGGSSSSGASVSRPLDDFISMVSSPVLSFFSFMAPQVGSKKHGKIYKRSQTIVGSNSDNNNNKNSDSETEDDHNIFEGIPKSTSAIESGLSVLIPPLPPPSFINDPSTRPKTIFHDKLYSDKDLPPPLFRARTSLLTLGQIHQASTNSSIRSTSSSSTNSTNDGSPTASNQVEKSKLEERLAREWHKEMTWRKVLVRLEPDAHNNIIVRRRFANAYGWPVIDHLVQNHFGDSSAYTQPAHPNLTARVGSSPRIPSEKGSIKKSDRPSDSWKDSKDLSSMIHEIDFSEDDDDKSSSAAATGSGSLPDNDHHGKRLGSVSSWSSDTQAWESHLKISADDDSDDEGIILSMGGIIDNIRGLGGLPVAVLKTDEPPEELEERINSIM